MASEHDGDVRFNKGKIGKADHMYSSLSCNAVVAHFNTIGVF